RNQDAGCKSISVTAVTVLGAAGGLAMQFTGDIAVGAPREAVTPTAQRNFCHALNRHLCERTRSVGDIQFLASPVVCGGVPVLRLQQLFTLALQLGKKPRPSRRSCVGAAVSQGSASYTMATALKRLEENIAKLTVMASVNLERTAGA